MQCVYAQDFFNICSFPRLSQNASIIVKIDRLPRVKQMQSSIRLTEGVKVCKMQYPGIE